MQTVRVIIVHARAGGRHGRTFEIIDLETAKALGLAFPPSLVLALTG